MNVNAYIGKKDGARRCWSGKLHKDPECRYLPDETEGTVKPVNADDFRHKEWCQRCARGVEIYNVGKGKSDHEQVGIPPGGPMDE